MIWAMWHGGSSYAVGYVPADVETFGSLAAAREVCAERYNNRDGSTPCVDDSSGMTVWFADPTGSDDPCPDRMIVRGRRGGWRVQS